MTIPNKQILVAGTGNKNASILASNDPESGKTMTVVSCFPKGHSVYALALSLNGLHIAAGTKAGLIRVHSLVDLEIQENASAVFELYHGSPVLALAFLTDDYLVSGGMDGRIKVWSITQNKQIGDFLAHPGGVFALRELGSLALSSLGADEKLRVWDMNSLTAIRERGPISLPKIHGLISLVANPNTGLLLHPSRSGELYSYNLKHEEMDVSIIPTHQGDFCAVAVGYGGYDSDGLIATGGLDDRKIKIWSPDLTSCLYEASHSTGIASLCWINETNLFAVSSEGKSQVWKIKDGLYPGSQISEQDIRTCITLPIELAWHRQDLHDQEWRDQTLQEVDALIEEGGANAEPEIFNRLEALEKRGFAVEAGIIFSKYAGIKQQPLWELETRLKLVVAFQNSKALLPELYNLAGLLIRLEEPEEAKRYLEKLIHINENYRNTKERLQQLKSHPLLTLEIRKTVHGHLSQEKHLYEEIEKCTLLQKKFQWKVLLQTTPPFRLKAQHTVEECWERFQEQAKLGDSAIDVNRSGIKPFSLYQNKQIRDVDWMYLVSSQKDLPLGCGVERRRLHTGSEWILYQIVDFDLLHLDESLMAEEYNARIKQAYSSIHTKPETKHWFETIHALVVNVIQKQAQVTLAQVDDEF